MLNVINALEKLSIDAQLMCEVTSNNCGGSSGLGIDNEKIRTLTAKDTNEIASRQGHEIQSIFIVMPRKMKKRVPQDNVLCG